MTPRKIRLSHIQKDVLMLLYAIKQKGSDAPVPSMKLLDLINDSRNSDVEDRNFRTSCHKLKGHGLVALHRSKHLRLAWTLTDIGQETAAPIFNERQSA